MDFTSVFVLYFQLDHNFGRMVMFAQCLSETQGAEAFHECMFTRVRVCVRAVVCPHVVKTHPHETCS